MISSRHVSVNVPADSYEKTKAYSEATGIPVTRIVGEALAQWLATTGASRLEALKGTKQ